MAGLAGHPRGAQRGAFVVLLGAVAAFMVTSTSAPVTGLAAQGRHIAAHRAVAPVHVTPMPAGVAPAQPAQPASRLVLKRKPTHVAKPAPVNHGVISGLAANGIPSVALNAYRVAAARMANVDPSCGIPWYLLAGIGREESDHGRFAGAVLHADGVSTPKIIGPALDGKHWDLIPAPANGLQLDGDAVYAHALGPMQFIPSTWAVYGADANGDGKADIFNINDAALGAARYLCAAGGNLRTTAGRTQAVLTYNHNDQYLAQVLALADAYRQGIPITGIPVGITKGALPTITDTGYIPPANPASPTAVDKTKAKKKAKAKPTKKKAGKGTTKGGGSGGSTGGPTGGTSGAPASGGSTAPTPGASSSGAPPSGAPTSGGGSGTAKPSPSPTTGSPAPTPTPTCDSLAQLLGMCKPS